MNRVSINRRFALAAGAAVTIAGLVIVGGAVAANAASTPTLAPAAPVLVAVDGAPDLSKVQPGWVSPALPDRPIVIDDGDDISVTEVPGAAPDMSQVQIVDPEEVDTPPVVVGDGGTTTEGKTVTRS